MTPLENKIERYLAGDMSDTELQEFEAQIKTDPDLQRDLAAFIMDAIRHHPMVGDILVAEKVAVLVPLATKMAEDVPALTLAFGADQAADIALQVAPAHQATIQCGPGNSDRQDIHHALHTVDKGLA